MLEPGSAVPGWHAKAASQHILPMPSPRLLVIEGNSPQTMADHIAAGGLPASKGYSDLLRELLPGAAVDICYPGDPAASLPDGESLEVVARGLEPAK